MKLFPYKEVAFQTPSGPQQVLDSLGRSVDLQELVVGSDSASEGPRSGLTFLVHSIHGSRKDPMIIILGIAKRDGNATNVKILVQWKPFVYVLHYLFAAFAIFLAVGNLNKQDYKIEDWIFPVVYLLVVIISTINFGYESSFVENSIRKALGQDHKKTSRSGG